MNIKKLLAATALLYVTSNSLAQETTFSTIQKDTISLPNFQNVSLTNKTDEQTFLFPSNKSSIDNLLTPFDTLNKDEPPMSLYVILPVINNNDLFSYKKKKTTSNNSLWYGDVKQIADDITKLYKNIYDKMTFKIGRLTIGPNEDKIVMRFKLGKMDDKKYNK